MLKPKNKITSMISIMAISIVGIECDQDNNSILDVPIASLYLNMDKNFWTPNVVIPFIWPALKRPKSVQQYSAQSAKILLQEISLTAELLNLITINNFLNFKFILLIYFFLQFLHFYLFFVSFLLICGVKLMIDTYRKYW